MNFNQLGNSTGNSRYCRIIVDLCPGSQPSAACGRQPCNCWSCTGPWWGPGASWQRAAGGFMESRCSVSCFIHPRTIKTKGLYIHTIYIYTYVYIVYLFVCLFVCLFACLFVCLFVYIWGWNSKLEHICGFKEVITSQNRWTIKVTMDLRGQRRAVACDMESHSQPTNK